MPWIKSCELAPPLTPMERESLAEGRAIARQEPDGVIVVCPRSIVAYGGVVSGVGLTYGPGGEDAFFHKDGRLVFAP